MQRVGLARRGKGRGGWRSSNTRQTLKHGDWPCVWTCHAASATTHSSAKAQVNKLCCYLHVLSERSRRSAVYAPCGLFLRMGSGIIWPLLSKLTCLRHKETCCLLAQVVLEAQVLPCIGLWACHTASATNCRASIWDRLTMSSMETKRKRGQECLAAVSRIPEPPATALEQAT